MYIDIVVLGLLMGLLMGGRIKNLGRLPLRGTGWFILLGVIEASMQFTQTPERQFLYKSLIMFAGALMMLLLWANRHIPGVKLSLIGLFLNFLVMAANGGRMPVSQWAAVISGQSDYLPELLSDISARHVIIGSATKLVLLADIIPLPPPYPFPRVLSIGDVILFAGIIRIIIKGMLERKSAATAD
ncbi:hypothetical protein BR63_05520 [Thermanaerosceptrum fracticalcis]|uniref:DUF5317 domain-containing protein n=1 Tax=Thermanaerosceptrum fracticalcis TaxID=1712410 RepID=A0A7G6E163_THEFR|nr:DUF5317 domain-containing protein [Thermanaerosceptrum fracticalcis]QNB45817.1 hypothetical protein BR63_05520 [Thermanaerosceptrum fracticalcis]